MSKNDDAKPPTDGPKTAADAAGNPLKRAQHPVSTGGEPRDRGSSASTGEIEGEVLRRSNMAPDVPATVRPRRKVGRRAAVQSDPVQSHITESQEQAHLSRPSDEEGTHFLPESYYGDDEPMSIREEKFAELQVAGLFTLATLAALWICVAYFIVPEHQRLGQLMNYALGGGLAVALLALGAGFVLWAKKLLPHDKAVQERHALHSPEEEQLLSEEVFFKGVASTGLGSRKILRRSLLGIVAVLPLPALVLLKDLGPLPTKKLRHSGWKAGDRLVDATTRQAVKLGDLEIGGIKTVMPAGFTSTEEFSLAPTMLIRFAPGEIRSAKELAWSKHDHVAYSKICTHAGCPISLYEQQTHHLLCPCHQSTFDMANNANVIFGPAARRLPQMQIDVDSEGYFVVKQPYTVPVGPSFWERG